MKPNKRQKLCQNCEGEIDLDVIVCPFCAADLRQEKPEERIEGSSLKATCSDQQMSDSLYPTRTDRDVDAAAPVQKEPAQESLGRIAGSIGLFTLGIYLLIFGIIMVFCSHQGTLTLKWGARYWFLYLFSSVPFIFFGYRALSKL